MKIHSTKIKDLLVLEPKLFSDERGYFFESYNKSIFDKNNLEYNFIQDNQSESKFGTLRGLHFQYGNASQAKLVRVISGKVLDVAVDLRKNSPTFGQYFSIELSGDNNLQLLIPRGFAHGFLTLSDKAIFNYKCDNLYAPQSDGGIRFDDPLININWNFQREQITISDKDLQLPFLDSIKDKL